MNHELDRRGFLGGLAAAIGSLSGSKAPTQTPEFDPEEVCWEDADLSLEGEYSYPVPTERPFFIINICIRVIRSRYLTNCLTFPLVFMTFTYFRVF